ncbi:MAG: hypothetical protein COB08_016245 [Rhodobacteraceae bacterium]|nr:hypothetical protein [Paracoccaceae bacterium]
MNTEEDTLTVEQAFLAMFDYLELHFKRFGPGEIGTVLGELSLLPDGGTCDPAAWGDWMKSVQKAKSGDVDAGFGWQPKKE